MDKNENLFIRNTTSQQTPAATAQGSITPITPQTTRTKQKLPIVISIIVVVLVVCVAALVLLLDRKQNDVADIMNMNNQYCSLANQGDNTNVTKNRDTKFTSDDSKETTKIFARVLNASPFIITVVDIDNETTDYDPITIYDNLFIHNSEKETLKALQYNDIISADLYSFIYAAEELALGTALKNIKKAKNVVYFHKNWSEISSSGVLLKYIPQNTNSNARLILLNDGQYFWRDNNYSNQMSGKLTDEDMKSLMELFGDVNFGNIGADYSLSTYKPQLSLSCERWQQVSLEDNATSVSSIVRKLEEIISTADTKSNKILSYETKIVIKDWEYDSIVPLDMLAEKGRDKQYRSQFESVTIPEQLKMENASFDLTRYRYKGKLYGVSGTDGDSGACYSSQTSFEENTFACVSAYQLTEGAKGDTYIQYIEWPNDIATRLNDIDDAQKSIIVPQVDYEKNKSFFESLDDYALLYLDGDYLYRKVVLNKN